MAKSFHQRNRTYTAIVNKTKKRLTASQRAVSLSSIQSTDQVVNACNQRGLESLNKGYKLTFVHG